MQKKLVSMALEFLGYPCIHYQGPLLGKSETGFDCSGFVTFLLEKIGLAQEQIRHCNEYFDFFGVFVHCAQRGDLVFFSQSGTYPSHMGIMISDGKYIHARKNGQGIVRIESLKQESISQERRDQVYFRNPIGFKRLAIKNGRYQSIL